MSISKLQFTVSKLQFAFRNMLQFMEINFFEVDMDL